MKENYQVVTESCSDIRALARQGLGSRWNTAALTTLLQVLVIAAPTFVITFISDSMFAESLLQLYSVLVGAPLMLGYIVVLTKIFRGSEGVSPMELFNGFEKLFKSVGLYIMVYLKVLAWVFPFAFPGVIMISANAAGMGSMIFSFLGSVLIIVGAVYGSIASFRYAMGYFVLADDMETPIMECINKSKRMMEGNKMKLLILQLSFIGWTLAAIVTCGIGSFWVKPYMTASQIAMYEIMTGQLAVDHVTETDLVTAEPKQLDQILPSLVKEENPMKTGAEEESPQEEQGEQGETKTEQQPEEYPPKSF